MALFLSLNNLVLSTTFKSTSMPCCLETIGKSSCEEMLKTKPYHFEEKCENDPDFAIIQCCKTCQTNIKEYGLRIFEKGKQSKECYDRHAKKFCLQFLYRLGVWSGGKGNEMSCEGDSQPLAFRICRKTCGYCDKRLYMKDKISDYCKERENIKLY
uniref:ShKT domain-containing protein n=1 Tax=Parastrongyloides trichosuri TaxID=131310 RepID=A0A0N4ZK61_PARTI